MLMIRGASYKLLTSQTLYGSVRLALNLNVLPFFALVVGELGALYFWWLSCEIRYSDLKVSGFFILKVMNRAWKFPCRKSFPFDDPEARKGFLK